MFYLIYLKINTNRRATILKANRVQRVKFHEDTFHFTILQTISRVCLCRRTTILDRNWRNDIESIRNAAHVNLEADVASLGSDTIGVSSSIPTTVKQIERLCTVLHTFDVLTETHVPTIKHLLLFATVVIV